MGDTLFDRAIYWLSDHPRATGFILAGLILGVGYFDKIPGFAP